MRSADWQEQLGSGSLSCKHHRVIASGVYVGACFVLFYRIRCRPSVHSFTSLGTEVHMARYSTYGVDDCPCDACVLSLSDALE